MADNVTLGSASGTVAADEVADGTLGTVKVQYVKIMDGTLDGTAKATVATVSKAMSAGYAVVGLASDSPGVIATGTPQASSTAILSSQGPATTASRINSAGSTNATSLKASAGRVFGVSVFNVAAYNVFLKFYDKASAPTVGTDTPVWTIPIQAGGGFAEEFIGSPFPFTLGIAYAITKLQADSDTTAVLASDLTGSVRWA